MTPKKLFFALLASIALAVPYTTAQTTPITPQPAKTTEATPDWPAVMKDLAQNNPALHEKIKTGAPLFFEWATRTKWQRRVRNALTMIAVPALMHELSVHLDLSTRKEVTKQIPFGRKSSKKKYLGLLLTRSLLLGGPSFIYNMLRTNDQSITLKEIVAARLATLILQRSIEAVGTKALANVYIPSKQEVIDEWPEHKSIIQNLYPDDTSVCARIMAGTTGMLTSEIANFFLLRYLLKKKQVTLKEQEAQVTQWLAAAGQS